MPRLPDELWSRAERFLPDRVRPLIRNADLRPHWLDERRFWYRNDTGYVLVDAETGAREAIAQPELPPHREGVRVSPDGKREIFAREHDLWLRDTATGAERRLTGDGEPWHAYGKSADMNLITIS